MSPNRQAHNDQAGMSDAITRLLKMVGMSLFWH